MPVKKRGPQAKLKVYKRYGNAVNALKAKEKQ